MGSVMIEENVVRAAGAAYCMDEIEIVRNIEDAGFVAKRRNMHYEVLGDPMFRERTSRGCSASLRREPTAMRGGARSAPISGSSRIVKESRQSTKEDRRIEN